LQSLGDEQRVRSKSDIDLISVVVLLVEQLHKCHICKKLIKSRLLFLRHLKMHNDKQRNSGSSSRMLRRKLRARPNSRRIASPRKRGRPRKFWSFSLV